MFQNIRLTKNGYHLVNRCNCCGKERGTTFGNKFKHISIRILMIFGYVPSIADIEHGTKTKNVCKRCYRMMIGLRGAIKFENRGKIKFIDPRDFFASESAKPFISERTRNDKGKVNKKEYHKAYYKVYYLEHKVKLKANMKRYYKKNKEGKK